MSGERPDPDAIYEAEQGFVSGRVPGYPTFTVRTGEKLAGSHPAVVEHFEDGFFRLAPEDIIRRQQAQILEALTSRREERQELGASPKRRGGRPPLTEDRVRADLKRALASLAADGKTRPGWDALAARHDGRTEFGLSVDALRKRRAKFPAVFDELVPDLPE